MNISHLLDLDTVGPCHAKLATDQPTSISPCNGKENRQMTATASIGVATTSTLKFGIENILQPEFGMSKSFLHVSHSHHHHHPLQFSPPFSAHSQLRISPVNSSNAALPSWIFCTRYSDRPSSGHRTRKMKQRRSVEVSDDDKRPRTAFTSEQLERLKAQFMHSSYLTEKKRQELAHELGLNECQIKIWFQNKRAKLKKATHRTQQQQLHNLLSPHFSSREK